VLQRWRNQFHHFAPSSTSVERVDWEGGAEEGDEGSSSSAEISVGNDSQGVTAMEAIDKIRSSESYFSDPENSGEASVSPTRSAHSNSKHAHHRHHHQASEFLDRKATTLDRKRTTEDSSDQRVSLRDNVSGDSKLLNNHKDNNSGSDTSASSAPLYRKRKRRGDYVKIKAYHMSDSDSAIGETGVGTTDYDQERGLGRSRDFSDSD
jgi:hypothetical protein